MAAQNIVASGCSLVPEGRQVFATMSVEENLILGGYVLQKKEGRQGVAKELRPPVRSVSGSAGTERSAGRDPVRR